MKTKTMIFQRNNIKTTEKKIKTTEKNNNKIKTMKFNEKKSDEKTTCNRKI